MWKGFNVCLHALVSFNVVGCGVKAVVVGGWLLFAEKI